MQKIHLWIFLFFTAHLIIHRAVRAKLLNEQDSLYIPTPRKILRLKLYSQGIKNLGLIGVLSVTEFWAPQIHNFSENGDSLLEGKPAGAWYWQHTQASPETASDFSCSSTPLMSILCELFHVDLAYTTSNQTQNPILCLLDRGSSW